jgi:hypothetical protein
MTTYTGTLIVSYQLCLSIELAYKVYKPNKKTFLIPLKLHHLTGNLLGLILAVIQVTLGEPAWTAENGCGSSGTYLIT